MTARQLLQDRKLGVILGTILVLAAFAIAVVSLKPSTQTKNVSKEFFSEDDGASYFRDSIFKFAPWDDGGKTAVGAVVYSEDGHNYVAYLRRFTPDALKKLKDVYASNPDDLTAVRGEMARIGRSGVEIKLPGPGHNWVPEGRLSTFDLTGPGPDPPTLVMP